MDLNLNGKRALVCGSTQGIGKAAAIELALLGANITLVARNEEKLSAVVKELQVYSGQLHDYLVADFSSPEALSEKVLSYCARFPVQILVNNTGGPTPGLAIDASPNDYRLAFNSHLICNQILAQAVVPFMKQEKFGRLINVISTSVKIPIRGLGVSNTIRAAVANWAKTLSVELGPFGITVNNVLPGAAMTSRLDQVINRNAEKAGISYDDAKNQMIREVPAGRIADPSEVAAAIAFLASPAASYINGVNIPVDGGRTGSL